jgi:hypothetical protein
VRRLPRDEDARGAHVVPHVDEQDGQVARPPEQPGQHDQPARLGEQRDERLAPVAHHAGDHLGDEQQHDHDRDHAEQLREVAQPRVRLDVGGPDAEQRVDPAGGPAVLLGGQAGRRVGARAVAARPVGRRGVARSRALDRDVGHPPSPEPTQRAR